VTAASINPDEEDEVFAELKATAGAPLKPPKLSCESSDILKKRDEKAL
jgi:hypothetical protein